MKILVTGCAGFIGMHTAALLLARGDEVVGIDDLNGYYDPALKKLRLAQLQGRAGFSFALADVADEAAVAAVFGAHKPQRVVHLAAQAGVRHSITHPQAYLRSNLVGFGNILEACRHAGVEHLVYASSSSVYGSNAKLPFSEHDSVDHPVSLYAATKKSNELAAHSYSHLYGLPTTGLRYFTVFGPWGRPDMSPWIFASAILDGREIEVFNHGRMQRDFTFIDDIAQGTVRVLDRPAKPDAASDPAHPDPASSSAPYRIYNIGNHTPVPLLEFIATLERALGVKARMKLSPMQPGDVVATCADVSDLKRDTGFEPRTPLADGLQAWADWFRWYRAQAPA